METKDDSILGQTRSIISEMELLAEEDSQLMPGEFSLNSIGHESDRFVLARNFQRLAQSADADLLNAIVGIVRSSRLSIQDKTKLWPIIGLE